MDADGVAGGGPPHQVHPSGVQGEERLWSVALAEERPPGRGVHGSDCLGWEGSGEEGNEVGHDHDHIHGLEPKVGLRRR